MRFFICVLFLLCTRPNVLGQVTTLTEDAFDGYTLAMFDQIYLLNNCGEIINTWSSIESYYHPKLLPNGNLLYFNDAGIIEKNWDDQIVKQVLHLDDHLRITYEVIKLENGNYLFAGERTISVEDYTALGFVYDPLPGLEGWPIRADVLVEMEGENGNIVWEWSLADHFVQEHDEDLDNFGIVTEHPELLSVEVTSNVWNIPYVSVHINGMDYNPELDQIVISGREICEVLIIDHSTTTLEASGHSGGNSGMGGDFLYRWGNPNNYMSNENLEQDLYYQHNPNWIKHGEHTGKIAIFNNGLLRPNVDFEYSTAIIIDPPINSNETYDLEGGQHYGPNESDSSIGLPGDEIQFYSNYTSGYQILPNGNSYITVGDDARMLEVNPEGELVWEFDYFGLGSIFRTEKYAKNYPAFADKDLTPSGTILNTPIVVDCDIIPATSTEIEQLSNQPQIWFDQSNRTMRLITPNTHDFSVHVFKLSGQAASSIESDAFIFDGKTYTYRLPDRYRGAHILHYSDDNSVKGISKKIILN